MKAFSSDLSRTLDGLLVFRLPKTAPSGLQRLHQTVMAQMDSDGFKLAADEIRIIHDHFSTSPSMVEVLCARVLSAAFGSSALRSWAECMSDIRCWLANLSPQEGTFKTLMWMREYVRRMSGRPSAPLLRVLRTKDPNVRIPLTAFSLMRDVGAAGRLLEWDRAWTEYLDALFPCNRVRMVYPEPYSKREAHECRH